MGHTNFCSCEQNKSLLTLLWIKILWNMCLKSRQSHVFGNVLASLSQGCIYLTCLRKIIYSVGPEITKMPGITCGQGKASLTHLSQDAECNSLSKTTAPLERTSVMAWNACETGAAPQDLEISLKTHRTLPHGTLNMTLF